MKNISVIIPTGGTPDEDLRLQWVLEGLCVQEMPPNFAFETIVVNDGGHEATQRVVESFAQRLDVQYLYHGPQSDEFRAAAARNLGAEHASADLLMFLDTDCVPQPLTVYRHFERLHYCGQGCLVQGVRRLLPMDLVTPFEGPLDYDFLIENSGHFMHRDQADLKNLISFNVSLSRADFDALDGWDETFVGWGGEDKNFGFRALAANMSVSVVGHDADVIHLGHPLRGGHEAVALLEETDAAPPPETPEAESFSDVDFQIVPAE